MSLKEKLSSKRFNETKLPDDVAIRFEHVTMDFTRNSEKNDDLKRFIINLLRGKRLKKIHSVVLDDITFDVKKGERLAVLGKNGCGKSTLLKNVVGVYKPTKGKVSYQGMIAPLLEITAGFDPNYTGMENIFLYGAVLGFSREFLESKVDDIIEFAELKEKINLPLKNYSSGQKARLDFAIATAVEPDILILDEVLSVGDVAFKNKCLDKINSLLDKNTTVLFVSHAPAQVRAVCNKGIYLEKGKIIAQGDIEEVVQVYEKKNNVKKVLKPEEMSIEQLDVEIQKSQTRIEKLNAVKQSKQA